MSDTRYKIDRFERFGCSGNYSEVTEAIIKDLPGAVFDNHGHLFHLLSWRFGGVDDVKSEWSESEGLLWVEVASAHRNFRIQFPCYPVGGAF